MRFNDFTQRQEMEINNAITETGGTNFLTPSTHNGQVKIADVLRYTGIN